MQYIDYENIAVSVLRSTPEMIDPWTLQPKDPANDNVTHTVTYFLSTVTMQIREGKAWQTEVPQVFSEDNPCFIVHDAWQSSP